MQRTIKLPYTTSPQAAEVIASWRKAQSVVIRIAYNRLLESWKDKEVLDRLRSLPHGKLDSWLTLSALKRAKAICKAHPGKRVIFGGKNNFQLRAAGKITKEQWRQCRLQPLYFEGHAKSFGEQGGNHRFVLDIANSRVLFYPIAKAEYALNLKLGRNSNYREMLDTLQFRCTWRRDLPFTVSLTETHICISWDEQPQPVKLNLNPNRVLSLDLNPNRIGVAVLEKEGLDCRVLHWAVYEYPELNQKLKKASHHPDTVHQNNKRLYELSQIAKEITKVAVHYQCANLASEHLNIATQDHGKGKSFNRAVNNQWSRKGFVLPLMRRLQTPGIKHVEVNPAYSSKMSNLLWGWKNRIPDPACAAAEIGRRFLQEDPTPQQRKNGGNQKKEERQVQADTEPSEAAQARSHWKKVWNHIKPRSGDTPRLTIPALKQRFPELCSISQSPLLAPQSLVARWEPARISHKASRINLRHYL